MTNSLTSNERKERLLQQLVETPAGERIRMKCGAADLRSVITDLLSLIDSQAVDRSTEETAADIVREWSEHDMNESYDSAYLHDEFGAGHLEERIALALTRTATAMRTACVEKVREFDGWVWCRCSDCRSDAHSHAVDVHASLNALADLLESL